jgi:cytochrome c-type biogenesis protein CcmH
MSRRDGAPDATGLGPDRGGVALTVGRWGLERRRRNAIAWAALAVVLISGFAIGIFDGGGPRTDAQRVQDLSEEIACPVCEGESVAQSNAPAAQNIRKDIARQVDQGRTDGEIRTYLAQQFGEDKLLRPKGEGVSTFVWAVPVVAAVLAAAGLVMVFRRWAAEGQLTPSPADRELVARYLGADDVGEISGGADGADRADRAAAGSGTRERT